LHTLPPFREGARQRGENLPLTMKLAGRGLNLPTFSTMTDAQVERVCAEVRHIIGGPSHR